MRKIGTITLAVSLIYYGIWMALRNINISIANVLLRWWPAIFILLGIEILLRSGKASNIRKAGFNVGILFMILLFFLTNLFYERYDNSSNLINNVGNNLINFNLGENTKSIGITKSIVIKDKKFQLQTRNAGLTIKRSNDNNVKLDLKVKVQEKSNINKYDINEVNEDNLTKVNIDENYVKGIEGTLFIPDGIDVNLVINNLKISSQDDLKNTNFDIHSNNGNFDLSSVAKLGLEADNGDVNIKDIKKVNLKVNNGKFNMIGEIENIDVDMKNGAVDINNTVFNSINIKANNGSIKLNTQDKNIDADLSSNLGECILNGEKINRGTLRKTIGDGSHKLNISLDIGSVRVNSGQE
ncbi:hypothetical protein [Clostridium sp.]|jgi:hypothetical protein|uniref:LiaF transmembrane domain-containing protein n=1 Tax=Clostridium sp. TaxID=1506 RepID=UPI00258F8D96|nr:hypothetical protein [Clostridium sp.]MDF2502994.1 hypothetical protein [Clostridium sp.]